jgi:hypothetical protein
LGARLGLGAVPAAWTARLENHAAILAIADGLAAGRSQLVAPGQRAP